MAEFLTAYQKTAPHEGGYSNRKSDRGGETYAGITRKNFPTWAGWTIVDAHKPLKQDEVINDTQLQSSVKVFYNANFWNRCNLDGCDSQEVANFIYDWYVNSGGNAIKHVQRVLGITEDGVCGPKTIQAANAYQGDLLPLLIAERIAYYNAIVAADPTQKGFLKGWVNRAQSFA
jgi:lysozyme family protein